MQIVTEKDNKLLETKVLQILKDPSTNSQLSKIIRSEFQGRSSSSKNMRDIWGVNELTSFRTRVGGARVGTALTGVSVQKCWQVPLFLC